MVPILLRSPPVRLRRQPRGIRHLFPGGSESDRRPCDAGDSHITQPNTCSPPQASVHSHSLEGAAWASWHGHAASRETSLSRSPDHWVCLLHTVFSVRSVLVHLSRPLSRVFRGGVSTAGTRRHRCSQLQEGGAGDASYIPPGSRRRASRWHAGGRDVYGESVAEGRPCSQPRGVCE